MTARRRLKQSESLQGLAAFASDIREKAAAAPSPSERDDLLMRARRADNACHIDDWANSPGLAAAEVANE
jgi:hypothetical protein